VKLFEHLQKWITAYLMHEKPRTNVPFCDFDKLSYEIRPADVLLVEGRSRISDFTKSFTQSPWSHAVLYIGRLHDIDHPILRQKIKDFYKGEPTEQLVIESLLGCGTIVSPLAKYKMEHIRICRPNGISKADAQNVIAYAVERLGYQYDVRQILDLGRFFLPWKFFPRNWRSSLFAENSTSTRQICSTLIAEAFRSVQFPILPIIKQSPDQNIQMTPGNSRLYTPKDFDYSPFFQIIKYPIFTLSENALYHHLPWEDNNEKIV
jgi:hypothetical protein